MSHTCGNWSKEVIVWEGRGEEFGFFYFVVMSPPPSAYMPSLPRSFTFLCTKTFSSLCGKPAESFTNIQGLCHTITEFSTKCMATVGDVVDGILLIIPKPWLIYDNHVSLTALKHQREAWKICVKSDPLPSLQQMAPQQRSVARFSIRAAKTCSIVEAPAGDQMKTVGKTASFMEN